MKNILFPFGIIIGVFFCWFPSYCVAGIQLPPTCVDSKTDQNGFLNELSTEDFNKSTIGALVDGVFVKSLIGVNMDSLRTFNVVSDGPLTIKGIKTENDSIVVTQKDFHKNPVRINGVDYTRFACTSFGKKVELLSLDDIRKTYFFLQVRQRFHLESGTVEIDGFRGVQTCSVVPYHSDFYENPGDFETP